MTRVTSAYPSRIVCLTEETTETLYLLGEGDRVIGVSGYTVRPPEARKKPRVSAFINARFEKIEALSPDLVLAFSDLQADIAAELVRRGYAVVTFNQRSVAEIFQMMLMVGGLVGRSEQAQILRRMGRSADLWHSVGRGAGGDRRRRAGLPGTAAHEAGQGSHRRFSGSGSPGSGDRRRVVVWQARPPGADRNARGLAGGNRRARSSYDAS